MSDDRTAVPSLRFELTQRADAITAALEDVSLLEVLLKRIDDTMAAVSVLIAEEQNKMTPRRCRLEAKAVMLESLVRGLDTDANRGLLAAKDADIGRLNNRIADLEQQVIEASTNERDYD
jgi:hypothetical protein